MTTIFVSGCAHDANTPKNLTVSLPARPDFMKPVAEPRVAAVKNGVCPAGAVCDARLAFRVTRKALRNANGRLSASGRWYDNMRDRYAGGKK